MPEQSLTRNQSENEAKTSIAQVSITDILKEMQQIPKEYWSNLFQIIQLYRESVTKTAGLSAGLEMKQETDLLAQQHRALSELNKQWIEDGDEQEQTETWEYLRQNLDQDRTTI